MSTPDFDNIISAFLARSKQYKSAEQSWGHCYYTFQKVRQQYPNTPYEQLDEKIQEFLCLHLSFYLASWGMYRGNTLIRQFDYTIHADVLAILFMPQYKSLWEPTVENANPQLIAELCCRIGHVYKRARAKRLEENPTLNLLEPTTTLITKILMGTMACIPAYDRYFALGIGTYIKNRRSTGKTLICKTINFNPTNQINKQKLTASVLFLKDFWTKINTRYTQYPQMKLIDMYFWEQGNIIERTFVSKRTPITSNNYQENL